MSSTFADVVHQQLAFSREVPSQALVLELTDSDWVQRLRDISQTANTRLVYMFSEHSRFGHSLGVAYLADSLMERLSRHNPEVAEYRTAVAAAALLHDVGHLAPGSHTAHKTWFPEGPDEHELTACRIVESDPALHTIFHRYGADMAKTVAAILREDPKLPPWTWEIISGGGWNVDRGNWCAVDSVMAGVTYGRYNIAALTESLFIDTEGHLALRENRLDAMMHFAVSRHAMYRQLYQHRVLLAADTINAAVVRRLRDLHGKVNFADDEMRSTLSAKSAADLPLNTIYAMRESWWRYHLGRWSNDSDPILSDLSQRLLNRRLFKTVRIQPGDDPQTLQKQAAAAVSKAGFDPRYYLHSITSANVHAGDSEHSLRVLAEDGNFKQLGDADPLFNTLLTGADSYRQSWLALPREAKEILGRTR